MGKWSGVAALGEMAKGAGQYYGTLASESIKTDRLNQARANKVADRDNNREYNGKLLGEAKAYASEQLTASQEYAEGITEDNRGNTADVLAERRAYEEEQADLERGRVKEREAAKNEEWSRRDGITQKNKLEAIGGKGGAKTASQVTHETRTKQAVTAYTELEAVMESYDPGGLQGGWDQMTVGGMTNFLASEDGKQYQSAAGRLKEAFLRAATGAAAPETENKSYINMFIPQFGDGPQVKEAKKMAMREQIAIMQEAYDEDIPRDVRLARFEEVAASMKEKYNLTDTSPSGRAAAKQKEADEFVQRQDARGNWIKTPAQAGQSAEAILREQGI